MKLFYIIISINLFLFSACITETESKPTAKKGFIDLSNWDFKESGPAELNGQWTFYWQELLEPNTIKQKKYEYIHVPQGWSSGLNESKKYPNFGYATYRIKIKLPDNKNMYRLKFTQINSAAKVWMNGNLVLTQGKIGDKDEFIAEYINYRNIIDQQQYTLTNDTLEVIIQVADYFYGGIYAGLYKKVKIGFAEQIHNSMNAHIYYYSFLAGIMFILAINYMILFFFNRSNYSRLFFALLSIVVLLRVVILSGALTPYFSMNVLARLYFVYAPIYPAVMAIFFYTNYKEESSKLMTIIFSVIGLLLLSFYLFFPPHSFISMNNILFAFVLFATTYLCFFVVLKALINKKEGALFAFIGIVLLLFFMSYDIFSMLSLLKSTWYFKITTGFLLFQVFQAASLSQSYSWAFKQNIQLNKKLEFQNINLEKIVKTRTETIEIQADNINKKNEELKYKNEGITNQNEEISQQNEEIKLINTQLDEYKNHLEEKMQDQTQELFVAKENAERADYLKTAFLENISHEIRTPLNAISGFANLMELEEKLSDNSKKFLHHISNASDSLLRIIDSIMQVSNMQLGEFKLRISPFNLNDLVQELTNEFKNTESLIQKKQLKLKSKIDIGSNTIINSDLESLRTILYNLIDNSIKFTEKGTIEFGCKLVETKQGISIPEFYVSDTGIGIIQEDIKFIFDKFRKVDVNKSKLYRGLGLGLTIAKSLVEQLGGEIWLESEHGKGSTFHFVISM